MLWHMCSCHYFHLSRWRIETTTTQEKKTQMKKSKNVWMARLWRCKFYQFGWITIDSVSVSVPMLLFLFSREETERVSTASIRCAVDVSFFFSHFFFFSRIDWNCYFFHSIKRLLNRFRFSFSPSFLFVLNTKCKAHFHSAII